MAGFTVVRVARGLLSQSFNDAPVVLVDKQSPASQIGDGEGIWGFYNGSSETSAVIGARMGHDAWTDIPIKTRPEELELETLKALQQGVKESVFDHFRNCVAGAHAIGPRKRDPTRLLLFIEIQFGVLRIVRAAVLHAGYADINVQRCLEDIFQGQEFPAAGLSPGRHRLLYPLVF